MSEDDIVTIDTVDGIFIIDQVVGIWSCLTSLDNPNLHMTLKTSRLTSIKYSTEYQEFLKEKPKSDPNLGGPTKPLTVPKESGKEIV